MQAKTFAIIASASILITVIDLIRREKMTFKYSVLWLTASAASLFFACFDQFLVAIARAAGFELPSNFVFFMLLVFFIFQNLFSTIHLNQQNIRTEKLAQTIGILEHDLNRSAIKK